jgi:hypothetical protein
MAGSFSRMAVAKVDKPARQLRGGPFSGHTGAGTRHPTSDDALRDVNGCCTARNKLGGETDGLLG